MCEPNDTPPGATYKITRRTLDRTFFFVPKEPVVRLWKYVLAVAAERYGVELNVVCLMSNHWHVELTDVRGELGEFLSYLHSLIARAINARLGRKGPVWQPGELSTQRIPMATDFVSNAEYIVMNPVVDGLVRTAAAWPGLITLPVQIGTSQVVRRPPFFFRGGKNAKLPAEASFVLTEPRAYVDTYGPGVFAAALAKRVEARESQVQAEYDRAGRTFAGKRKILATDPYDRPRTPADKRRRGFDPKFSCSDPARLKLEIAKLRDFRRLYHRARRLWLRYASKGRAVFPYGTYAMRRFHGCVVEAAPEDDPAHPPDLRAPAVPRPDYDPDDWF